MMRTSDNRVKAIVNVPGWVDQLEGGEKLIGTSGAYELAPLVHRAVRLRCDALASVPIHIHRIGKQITDAGNGYGAVHQSGSMAEWPFPLTPLRDLIWRTEAALLLSGGAYWLKRVSKSGRKVADVQWINPFTMDVKWTDEGVVYSQNNLAGPNTGPWGQEQMVYFREFNPADDIQPGPGAAQVAMEDARLLRYITRFASIYFENGAMPVTLLGFDQTPSQEEAQRVEGWFRRQMTGIANAFKVLALRGKVTPTVITPPLKDLAMNDLASQARHDIAMAFGIPQTMLEDAANYATAGEHRMSFWQDTVQPRGRIYEDTINAQLLAPMGLRIEFDFEEMGVFQSDEASRAGALLDLVNAGLDTITALEVLGYSVTEEQKARMGRMQTQTAAVAAIHNTNGTNEVNPQMTQTGADGGMKAELDVWERWALRRVESGKGIERAFEAKTIRETLASAIQGGLEEAKSAREVRAIFAAARRGEVYP